MHNNNNGYPSNLAAWTTVAILMVAYVLSFIDRQILTCWSARSAVTWPSAIRK